MGERLLTPTQVAEHLQVPVSTLYRWSYTGAGPKVVHCGRLLRYDPADVDAWVGQRKRGRP